MFNLIKFIGWKFYDLYILIYNKVMKIETPLNLYGIIGYFGLPGKGKSMAMTYELDMLRKKYGDKIYIATNYGFKGEDFHLSSWELLLKEYDKPLVVGYDEIQNEFSSREYKNFPTELIYLLTQQRKGNGVRIYYTAQRYGRVDKIWRELTSYAFECNTILGRWTRARGYHWEDYEMLQREVDVDKKIKIRPIKRLSFVQTNRLRNLYNSYDIIESAKSKEYITLDEQHRRLENK